MVEDEVRTKRLEREQKVLPRSSGKGNPDVEAAIEITRRCTAEYDGVEQGLARSEKILALVTAEIERLGEERAQQATAEKERSLMFLLKGGQSSLEAELLNIENSQLSDKEKAEKKKELMDNYIDARLLERMAAVEIKEQLIARLLNPYNSVETLAKATSSKQDEEGRWISEFQPQGRLANFISRQTLEEIRFGIQTALQIKQRVRELRVKYQDRSGRIDGRRLIKDLFGKNIQGGVEVVEGPISITVVVYDDKEYDQIHGESSATQSGGRHHGYLSAWHSRAYGDQFSSLAEPHADGLINIVRFSSYDSATVAHENEHSLYEIIMKTRGEKAPALADSCRKMLSRPQADPKQLAAEAVEEALFEAHNRFISGFANEVMAYVLNNEGANQNIDDIVRSNFRRLTTSELYSRHHLTPETLAGLESSLLSQEKAIRNSIDDFAQTEEQGQKVIGLLDEYKGKAVAAASKENIEATLRGIIRAVAELKSILPNNPNRIRAILAGQNPARWPKLATTYCDYHAGRIKFQQNIKREAEAVVYQQKKTARALLFEVFQEEIDQPAVEETAPEEQVGEKVKLIFDASADDEIKVDKGMLVYRNKKTGKSKVMNSEGKIVADNSYYYYIERIEGRLIIKTGKQVLDQDGRMIFSGYTGVNQYRIDEKGRIVALVGVDGKQYIATEDGRRIGMEFLHVDNLMHYQGKICFRANVDSNKWIIADEDGNQLNNDGNENVLLIEVIGGRLIYIASINGRKYYKDAGSHAIIGTQEGVSAKDNLKIKNCNGHIIIVTSELTSEGSSNDRYYLENGQEVYPLKSWNQFADVDGELAIRSAADGKQSWRTANGRIIGGEHEEVGKIEKFFDNTQAILVMDGVDKQPSYVNLDGTAIPFPLDVQAKRLELLKTKNGYFWIYTEKDTGDDNFHVIDSTGKMLATGNSIKAIEMPAEQTVIFDVRAEGRQYLMNDQGQKISEDYDEISAVNGLKKDAAGFYSIIGQRGTQYFRERLDI